MSFPSHSTEIPRARSSQTSNEQSSASSSSSLSMAQGRLPSSGAAVYSMPYPYPPASSSTSAMARRPKRERDGEQVDVAERDVKSRSVEARNSIPKGEAMLAILDQIAADDERSIDENGNERVHIRRIGDMPPDQRDLVTELFLHAQATNAAEFAVQEARKDASAQDNVAARAAAHLLSSLSDLQTSPHDFSLFGAAFRQEIRFERLSESDSIAVLRELLKAKLTPECAGHFLCGLTDGNNFAAIAKRLLDLPDDKTFLAKAGLDVSRAWAQALRINAAASLAHAALQDD